MGQQIILTVKGGTHPWSILVKIHSCWGRSPGLGSQSLQSSNHRSLLQNAMSLFYSLERLLLPGEVLPLDQSRVRHSQLFSFGASSC